MDEQNRKIRMATSEIPREQGHTIVGGRPAGARNTGAAIPRGLEVIMMKAAVDEAFLNDLIARRSELAEQLGFPLDPAEKAILDQVAGGQLRAMAQRTSVPEAQRGLLLGGSAAAAMIALVAQLTFTPVAGRAETPAGSQLTQGNQDNRGIQGIPVAQGLPNAGNNANPSDPGTLMTGGSRPEEPGVNLDGGHRPDVPKMPPTAGGARPDEPYKVMPPGGARPDIPLNTEPPVTSPEPAPLPDNRAVATSPLTLDTLRNLIVRTNSSGMSFQEAVNAIQQETGIAIMVEPSKGLDLGKPVSTSTSGMALGRALRRLCGDAAGQGALFEIQVDDTSLTIRFKSSSGGSSAAPDPAPHVKPSGEPSNPDIGITRGIRPDIPKPRGD